MAHVTPLQNVLFFGFGGQVGSNQNLKTKTQKIKEKWGYLWDFELPNFQKKTFNRHWLTSILGSSW